MSPLFQDSRIAVVLCCLSANWDSCCRGGQAFKGPLEPCDAIHIAIGASCMPRKVQFCCRQLRFADRALQSWICARNRFYIE